MNIDDRKRLLDIARNTILCHLDNESLPTELLNNIPESLSKKQGAFVTLHKQGNLRGCIGMFVGEGPLYETIQEMAVSAATKDYRFPCVSVKEMEEIDIEISVLSELEEIDDYNLIEVGTHGIYITRGFHRGVLLPQVATSYGWNKETFLDQTCIKAGLPSGIWREKGTKIEIFSAEIFGELE